MDLLKMAAEPSAATPAKTLSPANYAFLENYIHKQTGIALGQDKLYLLETRLAPVLHDEQIPSLDSLCDRVRKGVPDSLRRRIAECMTTHETSFFRDPALFDILRTDLLPALARQRAAVRTLRIWSAACSSGQEPYSLAMLLLDAGYADWKIEIVGTDLSSRILDRAAAGRFLQIEVNRGMPASLLVKYFQRAGADWQIRDEVRRMVRFAPFDLRQSMSTMGPFDLVLCRNVLIYFDTPTRSRILAGLRAALALDGYLLLGASETASAMEPGFRRCTVGKVVAYQHPAAGGPRP